MLDRRKLRSALERAEFEAARAAIRVACRFERHLPKRAQQLIEGRRPHPEIQWLLTLQALFSPVNLHRLEPAQARKQLRRDARVYAGKAVEVGSVRELVLDTPVPLQARHYAPAEPGGPHPLLVYFHGGGFVVGDLDTHDVPCRALCQRSGAHVLSVAYRLAPEHPFPAAVDDAVAAYDWARANAARLGADARRVAVGGDSAGANLTAVVTQLAKQAGKPLPALQLLLYPAVDRTVAWRSVELYAQGFFLTRADIDWYTRLYAQGADLGDPRISPLRARDLSGQSPALIVTAGFDPFIDEGRAYAQALSAAGNEVRLMDLSDLIHGFISFCGLSRHSHNALLEVADVARRMLARGLEKESGVVPIAAGSRA
jgi:acetyl esterase